MHVIPTIASSLETTLQDTDIKVCKFQDCCTYKILEYYAFQRSEPSIFGSVVFIRNRTIVERRNSSRGKKFPGNFWSRRFLTC
jgi:hypothetical protein